MNAWRRLLAAAMLILALATTITFGRNQQRSDSPQTFEQRARASLSTTHGELRLPEVRDRLNVRSEWAC
jgi:hypothetical protein